MVLIIKKFKTFRSRSKCEPTTPRNEKVLYKQITTHEQKDINNNNNNNNSNSRLKRIKEEVNLVKAGERFVLGCQHIITPTTKNNNMDNKWVNKNNDTSRSQDDEATSCKPELESTEKQTQNRIEFPPNKKGVSITSSSSQHMAYRLHLDLEHICASMNISQCRCLETFNRALSRRRGAVCEMEVAERKGLRLYIEHVLKIQLIKRYF